MVANEGVMIVWRSFNIRCVVNFPRLCQPSKQKVPRNGQFNGVCGSHNSRKRAHTCTLTAAHDTVLYLMQWLRI